MRIAPPAVVLLLSILSLASIPSLAAGQDAWPSRREVAAGAALLGTALLLDRTFDATVPDRGGTAWENVSDVLNYGGRPQYPAAILGGTWLVARAAGERDVAEGALHVAAGLAAGGVANGLLKYTVGRERPNDTDDPLRFHPFASENARQSFPSGHAVVAFSLASSLAEEAKNPWITAAAYGGATLVAWSRVYDDKHWTSDVVGGALIGITAGRTTVRLLHRGGANREGAQVALTPAAIAVRIPLP